MYKAAGQVNAQLPVFATSSWQMETAMRRSGAVLMLRRDQVRGKVAYLEDHEERRAPRRAAVFSGNRPARGPAHADQWRPLLAAWLSTRSAAISPAACEVAGIDGLRLHDLRHEATSRFFERGFNDDGSREYHWSQNPRRCSKRYTHLSPQDRALKNSVRDKLKILCLARII